MIRFNDGVTFNTDGEYRIESRHDGLYVVGRGLLCAVDSVADGEKLIARITTIKSMGST